MNSRGLLLLLLCHLHVAQTRTKIIITHMYTCAHTHIRTHARAHARTHGRTHAHVHMYTCTYTHTHTHTHMDAHMNTNNGITELELAASNLFTNSGRHQNIFKKYHPTPHPVTMVCRHITTKQVLVHTTGVKQNGEPPAPSPQVRRGGMCCGFMITALNLIYH